ncbi:MAG TPA: hypothetical protein VJG83_03970 [archaeon]|nr:hypothetical protein [archaeon]
MKGLKRIMGLELWYTRHFRIHSSLQAGKTAKCKSASCHNFLWKEEHLNGTLFVRKNSQNQILICRILQNSSKTDIGR